MDLNDCFEKNLLKKGFPDIRKSKISIKMAEFKLKKAKEALEKELYDAVIIHVYSCMFHSARAVLFKDGFFEKSHMCVSLYLQANYVLTQRLEQKYINILDDLREKRHEEFYGLKETEYSIQDADTAIKDAEKFLNEIKKILKL